jgi:hypothetical protein
MKFWSLRALFCLAALLLVSAACHYRKPMMYVEVANHSGHEMENLEVDYPNGDDVSSFGMPELRDGQTSRHLVPTGWPCKFTITFGDQNGKQYLKNFDLGSQCASETAFAVDSEMKISRVAAQP